MTLRVRYDHGVRQDPAAARLRPGHPRGYLSRVRTGGRDLGSPGKLEIPGVSLRMRRTGATALDTPCSPAWKTAAGLRGLRLAAAQRFSRPGVPRKSAVASAAREASAPHHPHHGTASARPALSARCGPGGGRGHKSPTAQPIRCLFPGEAEPTPPFGPNRPSNQHRQAPRNSGSCSWPCADAANFCKKGLVRSLAIPDESDSPGSH